MKGEESASKLARTVRNCLREKNNSKRNTKDYARKVIRIQEPKRKDEVIP